MLLALRKLPKLTGAVGNNLTEGMGGVEVTVYLSMF
jgi:hypothetical protein